MRRRAAVLAVSVAAAVALVALPSITEGKTRGDIRITSVVVNHGRTVVLDAAQRASFPVSVTATDDSGIKSVSPVGVWGPKYGVLKVTGMHCRQDSATTSTCTGNAQVDAGKHEVWNDEAGTWYVDAQANANDGDHTTSADLGSFSIKRKSRLGIYQVPATGRPGQQVTVEGWLSRAWWDTGDYHGSPDDLVQLMFRPDGSDTWTAVSSPISNGLGQVSASVQLTRSGSYQWYFAGSKWTAPILSDAKHVTVG